MSCVCKTHQLSTISDGWVLPVLGCCRADAAADPIKGLEQLLSQLPDVDTIMKAMPPVIRRSAMQSQ